MRREKLYAVVILSISLVAAGAPRAEAATATATMAVTATVLSVCTITALPLSFGNYSSTVLNATSTLSVLCTVSSPYNVGLDAGVGSGATVAARRMTNGGSTLNYKLTSDSAHSVNIGQTVSTDTIPGTGSGLAQTITIYGQIPAGQLVIPGIYTDTVTATITY